MKRGEIWLINLDPTVGSEIRKIRPAVIINDDRLGKLPLRVIVPITDWKDRYELASWMVKIEPDKYNNLNKTSSIDCFQVRSVALERFVRKLGDVGPNTLTEMIGALKIVLKINE